MNGNRHHTLYRPLFFAVVALGLAATAWSGVRVVQEAAGYHWLILASLTLLTGSFTLKLPGVNSKLSVADTLICTNLVLFGPAAGTITAALDGLVGSLRCKTSSRRIEFAAFNTATMALAAFAAGQAFSALAGNTGIARGGLSPASNLLPALALLALVYYFANTGLVAAMAALEKRQNVFVVWRNRFMWTAVNYLAAASVAGLLGQTQSAINPLAVLTILTAAAVIYLSSRSYVDAVGGAQVLQEQCAHTLESLQMLAAAVGGQGRLTPEDARQLQACAEGLARPVGRENNPR